MPGTHLHLRLHLHLHLLYLPSRFHKPQIRSLHHHLILRTLPSLLRSLVVSNLLKLFLTHKAPVQPYPQPTQPNAYQSACMFKHVLLVNNLDRPPPGSQPPPGTQPPPGSQPPPGTQPPPAQYQSSGIFCSFISVKSNSTYVSTHRLLSGCFSLLHYLFTNFLQPPPYQSYSVPPGYSQVQPAPPPYGQPAYQQQVQYAQPQPYQPQQYTPYPYQPQQQGKRMFYF